MSRLDDYLVLMLNPEPEALAYFANWLNAQCACGAEGHLVGCARSDDPYRWGTWTQPDSATPPSDQDRWIFTTGNATPSIVLDRLWSAPWVLPLRIQVLLRVQDSDVYALLVWRESGMAYVEQPDVGTHPQGMVTLDRNLLLLHNDC